MRQGTLFPECLPLPNEETGPRSAPTAHWTCECAASAALAKLNEGSALTPERKDESMPKDTIPGREGGLLPSQSETVGFPPFPRSKKTGTQEAILSVAARLRAIEDHFGLSPEDDDDGEEV